MTTIDTSVGAQLTSAQLSAEQQRTLGEARRRYGLPARALFVLLDVVYGKARTLEKFKVLEVVARVPYQAWEHVAYVAVTHRYTDPSLASRIFDRVREAREQQDNEQWHLLIIEELLGEGPRKEGLIRYVVIPQLLAFLYYQLSWLLYVVRPRWSYQLNADFEDHAEHEYAAFVAEHPELDDEPYDGIFADEYGRFATRSDLFRRIGLDERAHKEESVRRLEAARFR